MKKNKLIFLFAFLMLSVITHAMKVAGLTCEHVTNPLGMDIPSPVLSWQIQSDGRGVCQSAYELCVATSPDDLYSGKNLVWKTGKVYGSDNLNIIYKGKKLSPFTRYYWRVKVYDQKGRQSDWSEPAWWETSMLKATDWKSDWIYDGSIEPEDENDYYNDNPAPMFRKEFAARKNISSARLYIAAPGYYEAFINGKRVGDHHLDPGWTNYDKEILYSTYDVTTMLHGSGSNCIGVILGNGFYNPMPMPVFRNLREYLTIGRPTFKAQLMIVYADGGKEILCSDETWTFADSPIVRNNVYLGERYDARKEQDGWNSPGFDDNDWKPALLNADAPKGVMTVQMQPPVRVKEIIKPVRMTETRLGEFVFDMGQNFAGVARIRVNGPAGTLIKIRYGEDVYSDGSLNVMTTVAGQHKTVWNANREIPGAPHTAWQEDSYILKGGSEEIWMPSFTFHGFRYVEVTGWPGRPDMNSVEGIRMCADLEQNGFFECSNTLLNKLHKVLDYTFRSNVFSVESDCPAREKFGYGGDIVGVSRTFLYMYGMRNFYLKAIHDFANDQRPSGAMTETAPYNGIADNGFGDGSGPIGWQLAFGFLQKQLYEYYGDIRVIEDFYPRFQKQISFLSEQSNGYIIDRCINDHESLDARLPALFATAHFYHHVKLIEEFAGLLGKDNDRKEYAALSEQIKSAFIREFVKTGDGVVGNATPASQAFGLYYDLIPDGEKNAVANRLIQSISERNNHITAGIFGVSAIFTVLSDMDRNDVAYQMAVQPDFPGWGHMINSGATTLWETWKYSDNVYSHNHPMFGSVGEWMYRSLGGIQSVAPGFRMFRIKPQQAGDLSWVDCTYKSVQGDIRCSWKKDGEAFDMEVTVPANTKADIYIPVPISQLKEGNVSVSDAEGVVSVGEEDSFSRLTVLSGKYHFHR